MKGQNENVKEYSSTEILTWDQYKQKITNHIRLNLGPRLCRGHASSKWNLITSYHRNPNGVDFESYFGLLNGFADQVETICGKKFDTKKETELSSFLSFLQHHGFPTPLLDFTLSPYIAAFFAFSDYSVLDDEFVSIYIFDFMKWLTDYKQVYTFDSDTPHVSVLNPKLGGNIRQYSQQGFYYIFSNVTDIEEHILLNQKPNRMYLSKFNIPVTERLIALADLDAMGINHHSLFGTVDSWCRMMKDSFFTRSINGKGAMDGIKEIIDLNIRTKPKK